MWTAPLTRQEAKLLDQKILNSFGEMFAIRVPDEMIVEAGEIHIDLARRWIPDEQEAKLLDEKILNLARRWIPDEDS